MFVRPRRLRVLLPLVGLVASVATARAQTTTIVTTPTRLGGTSAFTIASGNTVIVQQGGSLTSDQITNNGTLEFAPTSGTMNNSPELFQGVGAYAKSAAGTLVLQQPSNTISGTWEISGGIVSYGATTVGAQMFGQTTVTLSGGFIKPTANDFSLDPASTTPD